MSNKGKHRFVWLRSMYVITIGIAGSIGIIMLIVPNASQWIFGVDSPHILSGLIGSVFLSFAFISVLGLREPIKFVPLLFMQLIYKLVWLCFVVLPLMISGKITTDIILVAAVFLAVVVGDVIAIPFRLIFKNNQADNRTPGI